MTIDKLPVRQGLITLAIATALSLSATTTAQDKGSVESEKAYQGAPSGIDPSTTQDLITSEGPPMTVEEFDHGKKIFFERCAGCHGVLRKGATGKPLTTDITRVRGTAV